MCKYLCVVGRGSRDEVLGMGWDGQGVGLVHSNDIMFFLQKSLWLVVHGKGVHKRRRTLLILKLLNHRHLSSIFPNVSIILGNPLIAHVESFPIFVQTSLCSLAK